MRTLIDIPNEELAELERLSRETKLSRAELVRRAIRNYMRAHKAEQEGAFGIWKKRYTDGLAYERKLRSEW